MTVERREVSFLWLEHIPKAPLEERKQSGESALTMTTRALSEMLRGFPSKRGRGAGPKTIERCRKWMAEQRQKLEQEKKQWDIIR